MIALPLWLAWWGAPALAAEMLVHGEVVKVVPISESRLVAEESGDCRPRMPAADARLSEWLAWDLRADCHLTSRQQNVITGYRVYYEWDHHVYDTVMAEPPSGPLPLRVTVE